MVPLTPAQTKTAYAEVIVGLSRTGYFDDAFGSSCVDDPRDPAEQAQKQLSKLFGTERPMWPLAHEDEQLTGVEQDWSEDLFFDVIEALHDMVARPRCRSWHPYGQHWDYQDFARTPGQAIYRWKVNELLARSAVQLCLAGSGSDRGRLVHAADDGRQDLVQRALHSPDPDVREDIVHAIALFRSRTATTAEHRSALFTLAGVFERRRALLRVELFKRDEDALFRIANEFDIRHRDKSQRSDYDPVFLDWLFWWYLATVELTDRLLARQLDERP